MRVSRHAYMIKHIEKKNFRFMLKETGEIEENVKCNVTTEGN